MARTRAAGDNGAYRDAPATRAVPRSPQAGGPRPAAGGPSRHAFGVCAVVAVFALVGVTLWRPLAALAALPVIIVLALVVRSAVPVPAPARSGGGTRSRPAREAPDGPARGAPDPGAHRHGRYDDRPPYDQEADAALYPGPPRRAGAPATQPPPAGRYRPAPRHEPEDVTEVYRTDEPGQPGRRRPADRSADARRDSRDGRRSADGRAGAGAREPGRDPAAPRRAGTPAPGAFPPDPYDRRDVADRHDADPRQRGSAAGDDRGAPVGRYPADPARPVRGRGAGEADDYRDARDRRRAAGDRFGGTADGRDRAAGAGQPDGRRPAEPGWRGAPGEGYPDDYQDRPGDNPDGYGGEGRDAEGYDEYPGYEDHDERGRDQGGPAGDRRRRGWRHQLWDDEGWDDTPEPEPDEDMMHTMSIDMRGYLDDTGSFRMP